jgi:hypothetical protein
VYIHTYTCTYFYVHIHTYTYVHREIPGGIQKKNNGVFYCLFLLPWQSAHNIKFPVLTIFKHIVLWYLSMPYIAVAPAPHLFPERVHLPQLKFCPTPHAPAPLVTFVPLSVPMNLTLLTRGTIQYLSFYDCFITSRFIHVVTLQHFFPF